jgi:hypothetical protein
MYSKYGTHDGQDVQAILESLDPDEELASVEGEVLYYVARLSAWIERNRGAWTLDQLGRSRSFSSGFQLSNSAIRNFRSSGQLLSSDRWCAPGLNMFGTWQRNT